ncbi:hypothetical protein AXF42_Ash005572 [Apostasia shenzhenica]|uniref:BED-type domain-containing protein n=1 Tax=Apostasia shenzhenica TaxID=1088818 RepID=A0A2I0B797_9ASPA|nr:hypothetical protein AXF42_Ash005572 [Apostasia shenzhenica]
MSSQRRFSGGSSSSRRGNVDPKYVTELDRLPALGENFDETSEPDLDLSAEHDLEASGDVGTGTSPSTQSSSISNKSRTKRSKVLEFFDLQIKPNSNAERPEYIAICKICKNQYSYKQGGTGGGIGTFKKHLLRFHKFDEKTCQPTIIEPTQTQLNPQSGSKPWAFRNDTTRRGLVRFVVRTEQPFTICEKEEFLVYIVQYLQPQYTRISRHTLKKIVCQCTMNIENLLSNTSVILVVGLV